MRLAQAGELSLVRRIRRRFSGKSSAGQGLRLGIGDDAAAIRPARGRDLLLSTDMMVEGVHFDMRWTTPFQLGYKLVSVNVSDIYAMGGTPEYLLMNFSAPADFEITHFDLLFDGIERACKDYKVQVVGGDVSSSAKIVLSATVAGSATKIITRSGAKPGDFIHVTGTLGDAAAGLEIMKNLRRQVFIEKNLFPKTQLPWEVIGPLVQRHLMPLAVTPDRFLKRITSMMDISDGLLVDLERLCTESRTGARILAASIPISEGLIKVAPLFKMSALDMALAGGEDYQLLFTSPLRCMPGSFCIGEVVKRSGIKVIGPDGKQIRVACRRGYEHFALQG